MAIRWYYFKDGTKYGPVSGQELKSLAAQGRLSPTDLISRDGLSGRRTASEVKGLFGTNEAEWHYAKGGVKFGPVSENLLKRLANAGELRPDDLIWKQGMADWGPASKIEGIFVGGDTSKESPRSAGHQRPHEIGAPHNARRDTCDLEEKLDEAATRAWGAAKPDEMREGLRRAERKNTGIEEKKDSAGGDNPRPLKLLGPIDLACRTPGNRSNKTARYRFRAYGWRTLAIAMLAGSLAMAISGERAGDRSTGLLFVGMFALPLVIDRMRPYRAGRSLRKYRKISSGESAKSWLRLSYLAFGALGLLGFILIGFASLVTGIGGGKNPVQVIWILISCGTAAVFGYNRYLLVPCHADDDETVSEAMQKAGLVPAYEKIACSYRSFDTGGPKRRLGDLLLGISFDRVYILLYDGEAWVRATHPLRKLVAVGLSIGHWNPYAMPNRLVMDFDGEESYCFPIPSDATGTDPYLLAGSLTRVLDHRALLCMSPELSINPEPTWRRRPMPEGSPSVVGTTRGSGGEMNAPVVGRSLELSTSLIDGLRVAEPLSPMRSLDL